MNPTPFFSVIIPVYNKENFVAKTLESVFNQTFTDFEVIVINDGSTDDSEEKILSLQENRTLYFTKKNEGVAVARNFGISKASGSFICFLDADDYWFPDFLSSLKSAIDTFPEQKVFATAIEIETSKNTFEAHYSIPKSDVFQIVNFFDGSKSEAVLWTSSVAIEKSVFDKIGVFDTAIKVSEDTDLWIRIGLVYDIVFIWKVLARYTYDTQGVSRNFSYVFEDLFFQKFEETAKTNLKLKHYLDLNRFSSIVKLRITGNHDKANQLVRAIDLKSLSLKKRILLKMPVFMLKLLIHLKQFLTENGLGTTVFR